MPPEDASLSRDYAAEPEHDHQRHLTLIRHLPDSTRSTRDAHPLIPGLRVAAIVQAGGSTYNESWCKIVSPPLSGSRSLSPSLSRTHRTHAFDLSSHHTPRYKVLFQYESRVVQGAKARPHRAHCMARTLHRAHTASLTPLLKLGVHRRADPRVSGHDPVRGGCGRALDPNPNPDPNPKSKSNPDLMESYLRVNLTLTLTLTCARWVWTRPRARPTG